MMRRIRLFFQKLGPGFITGSADDDPSGIATYSQIGAQFGYGQLWMALFSFPFMTIVQEMCGRIGIVTGKGLSGVIRQHYARSILYIAVALLFFANVLNIGADLGAMASAAQLVFGLPFWMWLVCITVFTITLEIVVPYRLYARFLKYLTLALLAYVITAFIVTDRWLPVLVATVVPHVVLSREYLMSVVAFLGTTISPYLFFWQADEEVEEEVGRHQIAEEGAAAPHLARNDIRNMRADTVMGMFFSNMITFFIIVTTASTLGAHGIMTITTADQAASALQPIAGQFAFLLFAVAIIGTGLLAVPILAGSVSYAFSEAFGWKVGLYRKFRDARGFYGVLTVVTLAGLVVSVLPLPPFQVLYYSAVLNGLCAPPLLILILLIGNNSEIMGKHVNGSLSNIGGWVITALMTLASGALLYSFF